MKFIRHIAITILWMASMAPLFAATVAFDAAFDGATAVDIGSGNYGAQITETALDAGTATGSWATNAVQPAPTLVSQRQIQTDSANNVAAKCLRYGIDIQGALGANTPSLTANLTSALNLSTLLTVSFDYASASHDGNGSQARSTYLTGRDADNDRLFQLRMVNTSPGNNTTNGHRIAYLDNTGTEQWLGTAGDLDGNNVSPWDPSLMKKIIVEIDQTTYSVKLAGSTLASGVAFRDAAANGLSKVEISANSQWTGAYFDNILVTKAEPPTTMIIIH